MAQEGYSYIGLLTEDFETIRQRKRELEAEEGRDITWGEFLLRATDK